MNIRNMILLELKKNLKLKYKILCRLFTNYSFEIYKIGFDRGFNYNAILMQRERKVILKEEVKRK